MEAFYIGMQNYLIGDFNILKFVIAAIGSIFVISSLFLKNLTVYILIISIGWALIFYSLALKRDSQHYLDFEVSKILSLITSYFLIVIGSTLLKNYRLKKPIKLTRNYQYTLILFLGVIFYVISKAILVIVELNLNNMSQYLTVISLGSLAIGKVIYSITSGTLLFTLSFMYYMFGFIVFLFNLSYNPLEKVAQPVKRHTS